MVGDDLVGTGGEEGDEVRGGQGHQVAVGRVVHGLGVDHGDDDNQITCIIINTFFSLYPFYFSKI